MIFNFLHKDITYYFPLFSCETKLGYIANCRIFLFFFIFFNRQKKVEIELEVELRNAKENQTQKATLYENEIREKETRASEFFNQTTEMTIQIKNMIADFMAKDKLEKASWDIENKRILESLDYF